MKYLGIVYSNNGYNYYIPLSSPKNSDYRLENGVQKIRGSIIRITSQSSSGELELKGTPAIGYLKSTVDFTLLEQILADCPKIRKNGVKNTARNLSICDNLAAGAFFRISLL